MTSPTNQPVSNAPEDSGAKDPVVPVWLIVVSFLLLYWGAVYFDEHGGWFDTQVYTPYANAENLAKYQVGGTDIMAAGRKVYDRTCIACHQANALGTPGTFPPLAGSDWVNEKEPGRMIRLVLRGFQGPGLVVKGQPFNTSGVMTAFGNSPPPVGLSDDDIAAVVSYVRGNAEWGNHASPVTPEQVKAIRDKTENHKSQNYSPAEILTVNPAE
jgi:mono/diheme cytochrome c family protein